MELARRAGQGRSGRLTSGTCGPHRMLTNMRPMIDYFIPFNDVKKNKDGDAIGVLASQRNIKTFLDAMGITLIYNEFKHQVLIDGLRGHEEISDAAERHIRFGLEAFGVKVTKDYLSEALQNLARYESCHPIKEKIENIKWDGVPRVDKFLSRYVGVESNEYVDAVGKLLLMGAIRRIYRPGCKFDTMLVIESPEGYGKSTLLKVLAGGDEYFTDNFKLGLEPKEIIEQTSGKWIVEVAEMVQRRDSEIEYIKNMLSVNSDRARRAFGRHTDEVPRAFVFIGTTNESTYLKSQTGNRRFWPVTMKKRADLTALKKDLGQIWAEALVLERAAPRGDEGLVLPGHLWEFAEKEQEARRVRSVVENTVRELLEGKVGIVKMIDLRAACGFPTGGNPAQERDLKRAAERAGFE
jgi:predicted P-loop ATPase